MRKFYDPEIYYDKNNKIITYEEYDKLRDDLSYKVIKQTNINKFFISTVWLGYSIDNMLEIPQIFETMIVDERERSLGFPVYEAHYETEEEALKGYEKAIEWLKERYEL